MAEYTGVKLKNDINISKLYTVHYFEFSKDYKFSGERHDFWEFVYADKGEVTVTADDKEICLGQGNVIFHKPNEWHTIRSNGITAPNIAIVSFECKSNAMSFFENKILKVGQYQKSIIAKIISEYSAAFSTPLNDPYTNKLIRKSSSDTGCEQLLNMYICEFLLSYLKTHTIIPQHSQIYENQANALAELIINYMHDNISRNITIFDIVKYSGSNKTTITNVFSKNFNMGPIEYFIHLKTEIAKKYLREDNLNITQISEMLGYANIHYFSRQFKKITGMSPTQYSISIKALLNNVPDIAIQKTNNEY